MVVHIPAECASRRINLSEARLVRDVRNDDQGGWCRFELRQELLKQGWQFASELAPADVCSRRLLRHRTRNYFQCLLHPHIEYIPGWEAQVQQQHFLLQRSNPSHQPVILSLL